MASMARRASTRGRWHPRGGRLQGREQRLDALPPFVGYPPIASNFLLVVTPRVGSYGRAVFPHRIPENNLLDRF
jgi:hypothetical protein